MSKVSRSLENRFKIRPTGVTSKKMEQGARIMLESKTICSFLAAFKVPTYNAKLAKNIKITERRHSSLITCGFCETYTEKPAFLRKLLSFKMTRHFHIFIKTCVKTNTE